MSAATPAFDTEHAELLELSSAIIEQAAVGIVRTNLSGQILQVNRRFCEIVGRASAELKKLSMQDITHPADLEKNLSLFTTLVATGKRFVVEKRYIRPDGSLIWVNNTVSAIQDAKGCPRYVLAVVHDITDRVSAEQARAKLVGEFERQARIVDTVLSSIPNFAYIFDRQGRFVFANKPLLDLWGLQLKDAVGKNFFDLKYPDELASKLQRQIQHVFETGQSLTDETLYVSPDGVRGVYSYIFKPVLDNNGLVELVAGSTHDITERKIAEEELAKSEAQFRQLADAMPQIVWAAQPDGSLDYYNRRWFEYIDCSPADLSAARWDRYVHPDDMPATARAWQEAIQSGKAYAIEFRIKDAAGNYRWFLVRALPIRDEQGGITRWLGTCTDIHDQKQLQTRNEELLESERAARATAERASQVKDEFLATLSHELRTPLAAILGWVQLMRRRRMEGDDLNRGLETIERNARVQTQLIEDLLDMSRIISGKLRLDIQQLQPVLFIEEAVQTVMPAASAKGIQIVKILDPMAEVVWGDPNRLQQVVWNLLSNAIKFTPRGGTVRIFLNRVESHLQIKVEDTGLGIAAEFLPHVFDRFRQADAATNRKHGGLGLGLAIVKQLVELHGGTVRVESDGQDRGTTFIVMLPTEAAQGLPHDGRQQPASVPGKVPIEYAMANLSGLCVLVVDDEHDARELVKRVLEDCNAEVMVAGSAAEALATIRMRRPDVLVSDIGMPEVDGYEFLRRARSLWPEESGTIRAVALTAFARSEDRTKALLAGYTAHLSKPMEPSELVATVASVAGRTGKNDSEHIGQNI